MADEGGDEREDVTEDEEDEGNDSRSFRADAGSGILLESGGEYEETGDGQLRFALRGSQSKTIPNHYQERG